METAPRATWLDLPWLEAPSWTLVETWNQSFHLLLLAVVVLEGEGQFHGHEPTPVPSLCSHPFTRLIACGGPATTGWWRGQPGPASTLSTEGLGTSRDDKYPFSLSGGTEGVWVLKCLKGFQDLSSPTVPLWPQSLHFIWWMEAIKINEL